MFSMLCSLTLMSSTDGIHNGGIVDGFNWDVQFSGSDDQIGMCGSTEWITDNQEGNVVFLGVLQNDITARLD
ncbi:hypothetical protein WICPIJ_005544 [Wickerhamomyces pijperi]|uniref:Uncharacterized protein n=1 Tax=Wickerhamomyces pijperi TaxID=599730 RepID=A0A9P8Q3R3_WICPI|nr:hypothetical protein WICPIJ_005544 [Wickerhamomyces pijperi]